MRAAPVRVELLGALLLLVPSALGDSKPLTPASIRGLNPALYDRYEPSSGVDFTCLDGSRSIPWSALNDDYCDCPDGSDEPGTSACEGVVGATFYCKNEGHIPGVILSSRVNDGICDPECCDGSDEWATGACPNRCFEIGKEYRAQREAELKTRKTGAKIRGTYVKWVAGERKRLEDELEKKRAEVLQREVEVERARIALERTEARSKEELEKRKGSPLYTTLLTHRSALTRLRARTSRLEKELEALHNILDELSKGYNPNYQDMAVKAAVVGYGELLNPPQADGTDGTDVKVEEGSEGVGIEDRELDELERKDLEGVLLADLEGMETEAVDDGAGLLWKIDEYIPDALYDSWETVRDLAIEWMIKLGIVGKGAKSGGATTSDGPHVAAAKEAHRELSNQLNRLNNDVRSAQETWAKLSGNEFGRDGEWKKLDGTCVDKVSGDYTYEVCFFGRATQRSNKDSSSNFLGSFTSWNPHAQAGTDEYYTQQLYLNGAKCWNGPMRSATVDLSCGTTNALLSVSEPEKCEYRFKVTSPALCYPVEEGGGAAGAAGVKAEL
ncbi:Alpha-glucosidase 2 subunit beta [Saitozyma sp. JCM 24511]|nr:Alpha-glucosidase 2 subunit beta [Saitozyma sp. JCM 24511]